MTGLIRKATLLTACGVLVAGAAMAGIPSALSTVPADIYLVGFNPAPDSTDGKFTCVIRDAANNVLNGSNVVLDLSGCSDGKLQNDQKNVNYTVNCPARTVGAFTNVTGTVAFTLLGGSTANVGPFSVASCARLLADGVQLATPTVHIYNLNNTGGVDGSDLAICASDVGAHVYRARTDYDKNLAVNGSDFAVFATVLGAHRQDGAFSAVSCP